jgi:hypothetical protein
LSRKKNEFNPELARRRTKMQPEHTKKKEGRVRLISKFTNFLARIEQIKEATQNLVGDFAQDAQAVLMIANPENER